MKIALMIFLVLMVSFVSADLEEFPEQFFDNGDFKGKIIVGAEAPPTDVTSAIKIIPALQSLTEDRIRGSTLDSDVDDYTLQAYNLISIGNPCDNEITAEIMNVAGACSEYFEPGNGYIYLYTSELNKSRLIIGGGTPTDTAKAALVLGNYQEYRPWGVALIVKGNEQPYTLIETNLPGETIPETPELLGEDEIDLIPEPNLEVAPESPEQKVPETHNKSSNNDESQDLEKELEDRKTENYQKPEQKPNGPVHVIVWEKFKSWLSWFFR